MMPWGDDNEYKSPLDKERAAHLETKRILEEAQAVIAKLYRTIAELKLNREGKQT